MLECIIFLLIAFAAAFVATIAGFGSSTLLIPFAIIFFDAKSAIVIVGCFHLFNNLLKMKIFWEEVDRKLLLMFGLPSIVAAFVGAWGITVIDDRAVSVFVALFLIGYSAFSFIKLDLKIKNTPLSNAVGGSFSGFLAGLIGLGGALRAIFLMSYHLPKNTYIGTSAMIALLVDLTRLPAYIAFGAFTQVSLLFLLPFLLVIAYFGVKTGKQALNRINEKVFRRFVFAALFLVGLRLLFS